MIKVKMILAGLWSLFGKEKVGWWAVKEVADMTETPVDNHLIAAAEAARNGDLDKALAEASLALDAIKAMMDEPEVQALSGDNPIKPPRSGS